MTLNDAAIGNIFLWLGVVTAKHLLSCSTISWIQYETLKIIFHKNQMVNVYQTVKYVWKKLSFHLISSTCDICMSGLTGSWIILLYTSTDWNTGRNRRGFPLVAQGRLASWVLITLLPVEEALSPSLSRPTHFFHCKFKPSAFMSAVFMWAVGQRTGQTCTWLLPWLFQQVLHHWMKYPAASSAWKARSTHSHPTHQHTKHAIIWLQMEILLHHAFLFPPEQFSLWGISSYTTCKHNLLKNLCCFPTVHWRSDQNMDKFNVT